MSAGHQGPCPPPLHLCVHACAPQKTCAGEGASSVPEDTLSLSSMKAGIRVLPVKPVTRLHPNILSRSSKS